MQPQRTYRDALDIGVIVSVDRQRRQASKAQERGKAWETHIGGGIRARLGGQLKERPKVGWTGLRCHQDPMPRGDFRKRKKDEKGSERAYAEFLAKWEEEYTSWGKGVYPHEC